MPYLKADAPTDFVKALKRAEDQADECWRTLDIRYYPSNIAIWALLTGGIGMVEREQAARGSNTFHFDAMLGVLSRLLPIAVKWSIAHGQPARRGLSRLWSGELAAAAEQALAQAKKFTSFEVCFQGFYKGRYAAEMASPTDVRFSVPGMDRDRQVSAYQKGLRPRGWRFAVKRGEQRQQEPHAVDAFFRVLRGCREIGSLAFEYGEPWELWRDLLPEYAERVKALSRRADTLSLGDYTLAEFNSFYVALIVVCAAHDHLCFLWTRTQHAYPVESAVMVRSPAAWAELLSGLSGVASEKCGAMIGDLTFSIDRSIDLHVYPFVPLDAAGEALALAAPFPLHSRHDENILRVCSQRRGDVFNITSLEKQSEMLASLQEVGRRFGVSGPVRLPKPTPDIDMLAVDESCSTVVVAELKWIRKTMRPAEIPDRDQDVLKGVGQLQSISAFLSANPDYLLRRGRLARALDRYERVHYVLIARDHLLWVEPRDGFAIVGFEPFVCLLERVKNLREAIAELLTYDWLPVEGRDFKVQYDQATANGIAIESPVFYSMAPA